MQQRHLRVEPAFLVRKPCGESGLTARLLAGLDQSGAMAPSAAKTFLRRAMNEPEVSEAVLLASPVLWRTADRISRDEDRSSESQLRRAALAMLKYVIRMETRPTPFGLFAGVYRGHLGPVAKVETTGPATPRVLVDSVWLNRVVQPLEADADITCHLRVRTHQALRTRSGRVVLDYPSALGTTAGQTQRVAVSIRDSLPVRRALELAQEPMAKTTLTEKLTSEFSAVDAGRVRQLIEGLISTEMLVSELRQPLDASDDLERLIALLAPAASTNSRARQRSEQLRHLDEQRTRFAGTPTAAARVGMLAAMLRTAREIEDLETPLHIDVRVGEELSLPDEVGDEVAALADVLYRLAPARLGMRSLRHYHQQVIEDYGTDRLVPLLELIDTHSPLGPPNEYQNPPNRHGRSDPPEADTTSARQRHTLLRIFHEAITSQAREVVLDDATIEELAPEAGATMPRQPSSELYVQLVASSVDALSGGEFLLVLGPNPGSHQAGATAARFNDILDVTDAARAPIAGHDQRLGVDLVFRPVSDRAGNIAHTGRPGVPRLACGTFDSDDHPELRISDIAIGANLDRMYAVHLPTGAEILPQVSNMLSATVQAPNPMRLLFEIGHEGQRLWEPWNWGPLAEAVFLPRVRYRRSVLAPATWRPETLVDNLDDVAGWGETVQAWRQRWRVPRRVLLVTADQRLLVDLSSGWHREMLREELRRNRDQVLVEVPGDDRGWVDGDFGGHVRELVFEIHAIGQESPPAVPATLIPDRPVQASSDDWLYLKIYPTSDLDHFITTDFSGIVEAAVGAGAGAWFFIRYSDRDGHHLRLRLRTDGPSTWGHAAAAVMAALDRLRTAGSVGHFDIETWDPEFERYGGVEFRMPIERIFEADSIAAAWLLQLAAPPASPLDDPYLVQAVSVAALAHAFGNPHGRTGPGTQDVRHWLDITGDRQGLPALYRKDAKKWQQLIDPAGDWAGLRGVDGGADVLACLADRDTRVRELAIALAPVSGGGRVTETRIVGSLMHMTCNRLAGSLDENVVLGLARGAVQDNARRRERLTT